MKILTVDDSRTIRRLVAKYLSPFNFEILEAADGKEGVALAKEHLPDLIILDVTMPVMDGGQALEALREDPETKHLKVIMLTAESRRDMVLGFIQLGIVDYIVKPFVEETFKAKVCKAIGIDPSTGGDVNAVPDMKPRVLVLDDRPNVLTAAKRYLEGVADVFTATNGYDAVELANKHKPAVVILDLVLPDCSTFEIFSMMRANTAMSESRFVAMAIRTMRDEVERAHRGGYDDLLQKPFDKNQLIRVIRRNLPSYQNLQAYDGNVARIDLGSFIDGNETARSFIDDAIRVATEALREAADSGYNRIIIDVSGAQEGSADMSMLTAIRSIQEEGSSLGVDLVIVPPSGTALGNAIRQPGALRNTTLCDDSEAAFKHYGISSKSIED